MVAGTPTARTYQHIVLAVSKELAVDSFYIIGYIKIIHRREVVIILHINHINHIFADAMTQRIVRTQQAVGIRDSLHIFIKHLLGIDDRTNLKKIEFASPVIIDIAGKLYLHWSAHSPCSILHRHLQYLWQRHHSMLEHTREGYQFAAILIDSIIDDLIVWIKSRCDIGKALVFYSILHPEFKNIKAIVYLEIIAHMLHIQRIELGLGVAQSQLCFRCLEHLIRMVRTNTKGLTSIYDIFTQAQGKTGYTLFSFFITYRIVIERTEHTAHGRIKPCTIVFAHNLLQDNSHLFLIDDIARCGHVSLRITIEHRSIDSLDGTGQHLQHLILIFQIWNHIGRINTGKWLIVGIFEQRT